MHRPQQAHERLLNKNSAGSPVEYKQAALSYDANSRSPASMGLRYLPLALPAGTDALTSETQGGKDSE